MNKQVNFNQQQEAAVHSTHKRILCLAGAGTGKTKVLTHRIARAWERGTPPGAIVALTFTRAAGAEMRERLEGIIGPEAKRIFCDTFHAFAAKLLREEAEKFDLTRDFLIVEPDERLELLQDIIDDFGGKTTLHTVNKFFKGEKISLKDKKQADRVAKEYNFRLRQEDSIDFDTLITHALTLAEEQGDRFTYVFVDEFQDTDPKQWAIVQSLNPENLFLVGDDYQAIYGFRGGDISIILDLVEKAEWQTIKLVQNYRSTRQIVETANALISHNNQPEKALVAQKDGAEVRCFVFETQKCEVEWIAQQISKTKTSAILARTNTLLDNAEHTLQALNLPYKRIGAGEQDKTTQEGEVVLATVHGSKGLEFDEVFVVGVGQGEFPHNRNTGNVNEERRLFYVAITRAKELLTITWAKKKLENHRSWSLEEVGKSQFITEANLKERKGDHNGRLRAKSLPFFP